MRRAICIAFVLCLCLACHVSVAYAQESQKPYDCYVESDDDMNYHFRLPPWIGRGICVRRGRDLGSFAVLEKVLENINQLKQNEYSSAAGVLSLLPTIGALLGPPTREIWRLRIIVPIGGFLAMLLSFGGALMPVRIEDYEDIILEGRHGQGSVITLSKPRKYDQAPTTEKADLLAEIGSRVRDRIDQPKSIRLPKGVLFSGLLGMFLLWAIAQGAIAVTEQGGVVHFWPQAPGWFHFWYIFVTFTAFTEDRVHRPFVDTYKLLVSSLPYDVEVSGGTSIISQIGSCTVPENVGVALCQLKTLKAGRLTLLGSDLRTRARNSVMVTVSVAGPNKYDSWWKHLSKCLSVMVFVTGTTIFASVSLLSLIVAISVLTATLGAGVFGRVIIGFIISSVSDTEPMLHVITANRSDAYEAITEILCLKAGTGALFQVELDGQIFIDGRRVASRSRLSRLKLFLLGVLVEPYDVTYSRNLALAATGDRPMGSISPQRSNVSGNSAYTPFLPTTANPILPFSSQDHGSAHYIGLQPQPERSLSRDSVGDPFYRVARKPVPNADATEV